MQNNALKVPPPEWWDELPLLAFVNICKYLPHNEVFGTLPAVCQHFNNLLKNNTVGFEKIQLRNPSETVLQKLSDKTSTCKSLELEFSGYSYIEDECEKSSLSNFLEHFKDSLINVTFTLVWTEDVLQNCLIASFNEAKKIQSLKIDNASLNWDWASHTVCTTLKSLQYNGKINNDGMSLLCNRFPHLQNLQDISFDSDVNWIDLNNYPANLKSVRLYLPNSNLPPLQFFRLLHNIYVHTSHWADLLIAIEYAPMLSFLTTFELTLFHEDYINDSQIVAGIVQLSYALPNTVGTLIVSSLGRITRQGLKNTYDLDVIKSMDRLPLHFQNIKYNGYVVRDSARCKCQKVN
jgi:hypothetical protein